MAFIKIPTPLRAYTGGKAEVEVHGATIATILDDLVTRYPELHPHLFNENELRNFVNIFVGEEDIRYLEGLATEVAADAKLRIIPSIAGGK